MMGGEGDLLRSPFDNLSIEKWPSDFVQVYQTRRQLDFVEREIYMLGDKYPKPTFKTKVSRQGFEEWKNWVEYQNEKRSEPKKENEPPYQEYWDGFFPNHIPVFDHLRNKENYIVFENLKSGKIETIEELKTNKQMPYNMPTKRRTDG
jgi:hypothetical protein